MSRLTLSELQVGLHVEINLQSDRSRKTSTTGLIKEILTKSETHPHGILVQLETGEKGRVTSIILKDEPVLISEHKKSSAENAENLETIIELGENHTVEFKYSALWSSKYTKEDIASHRPPSPELFKYGQATSKIIIAKSVAGFLNTDGGTLVIGIIENKSTIQDEVAGIEKDIKKLKDPCTDGYRRMLVDLFKDYFPKSIFNHLNEYVNITFEEVQSVTICRVKVHRSDHPVFSNFKNEEHFFIRTDASTREISGSEVIEYCDKRFSK